jgi:hypothetical protein
MTGQKRWLLTVAGLLALSFVQCLTASLFDDYNTDSFWVGAVLFVPAGTIGAIIERRLGPGQSGIVGAFVGVAVASIAFWLLYICGGKMAGAAAAVGEH